MSLMYPFRINAWCQITNLSCIRWISSGKGHYEPFGWADWLGTQVIWKYIYILFLKITTSTWQWVVDMRYLKTSLSWNSHGGRENIQWISVGTKFKDTTPRADPLRGEGIPRFEITGNIIWVVALGIGPNATIAVTLYMKRDSQARGGFGCSDVYRPPTKNYSGRQLQQNHRLLQCFIVIKFTIQTMLAFDPVSFEAIASQGPTFSFSNPNANIRFSKGTSQHSISWSMQINLSPSLRLPPVAPLSSLDPKS